MAIKIYTDGKPNYRWELLNTILLIGEAGKNIVHEGGGAELWENGYIELKKIGGSVAFVITERGFRALVSNENLDSIRDF